jgi:D-alanyl-D-alanine carboxypeptidase/D-alanyl-D-alanine-endopeptidase (penicillin-binding protein 4)
MLGAVLFGAAAPRTVAAQFAASTPAPSLQEQLDEWYRRASRVAPGSWGIAIAWPDGQLLWGVNPTTPLIPASTVKIFTTGFARTVVGADARRPTRVVGQGRLDPNTGEWQGPWALELNGDFTLERPGRSGPTLADLAAQLASQGIRALRGPLQVLSESGEADARYPASWADRHRGRTFAPPVGALTLNENVITLRIAPGAIGRAPSLAGESPLGAGSLVTNRARTVEGRTNALRLAAIGDGRWTLTGTIGSRAGPRSLTVVSQHPRVLLEAAWQRALRDAGVEWHRESDDAAPRLPPGRSVLAEVFSLPFDSLASEVNARSHNLGAELLLRWAGGEDQHLAASALTRHVRQVTGDPIGVTLADGSGLSDQDRASAWSFVAYLARVPYLQGGGNFPLLLPANGEGTLRHLTTGLPGQGVVRAKTGTLGNVASVSGYLGSRDGLLLVSVLYNGARTGLARQEQWRLFRLLGADGSLIPAESDIFGGQLGGQAAPGGTVPPTAP